MRFEVMPVLLVGIMLTAGFVTCVNGQIDIDGVPIHKEGGDWIIRKWLVLGPFVGQEKIGRDGKKYNDCFRKDYLEKFGGEEGAVLKLSSKVRYQDENGRLNAIIPRLMEGNNEGLVGLGDVLGRKKSTAAYAFCYIDAVKEGPFLFYFSSGDCGKVWVNGTQVHRVVAGRESFPHNDNFVVHLKKGLNPVLVKIKNHGGHWNLGCECNRINTVGPLILNSDGVPVYESDEGSLIRNWLILGGFRDKWTGDKKASCIERCTGYDKDYLVSVGGEAKARITKSTAVGYEDRMAQRKDTLPLRTKAQIASVGLDGIVDFRKYFDATDENCGYAYCYIKCYLDTKVRCYFSGDDLSKVWVNGGVVFKDMNAGWCAARESTFDIQLKQGLNPVLVKVCNGSKGWGFILEAETIK